MTKSAQVVLSGYDKLGLVESVETIRKLSKTINVKIIENSEEIKAKSKLWGCEKDNLENKTLFLSGAMEDLQKILHAKTKDGIYLQLLLK